MNLVRKKILPLYSETASHSLQRENNPKRSCVA